MPSSPDTVKPDATAFHFFLRPLRYDTAFAPDVIPAESSVEELEGLLTGAWRKIWKAGAEPVRILARPHGRNELLRPFAGELREEQTRRNRERTNGEIRTVSDAVYLLAQGAGEDGGRPSPPEFDFDGVPGYLGAVVLRSAGVLGDPPELQQAAEYLLDGPPDISEQTSQGWLAAAAPQPESRRIAVAFVYPQSEEDDLPGDFYERLAELFLFRLKCELSVRNLNGALEKAERYDAALQRALKDKTDLSQLDLERLLKSNDELTTARSNLAGVLAYVGCETHTLEMNVSNFEQAAGASVIGELAGMLKERWITPLTEPVLRRAESEAPYRQATIERTNVIVPSVAATIEAKNAQKTDNLTFVVLVLTIVQVAGVFFASWAVLDDDYFSTWSFWFKLRIALLISVLPAGLLGCWAAWRVGYLQALWKS